ncbi:nitroreductase family protein [Sphingobacterium corticis]|uniref:Nitroreductase family protein n=1 Tax=Sphingobacterium corticis TaxID=1812823 RepID=A0ABW5NN20_9SPHI
MHFKELSKSRYTTKKYDSSRKIPDFIIEELKEIISLSPSSINSQPWHFTFVANEKVKAELASLSFFNEQKINEASHLVVFSAIDDIARFEQQINENLPEGSVNYYNQFVKPLGDVAIKSWLQHQVYLSLGFFLAACASLAFDSTPMEGIQGSEYDKVLKQDGYKTLFAVAIGYRSTDDKNQPELKPKTRLPLIKTITTI